MASATTKPEVTLSALGEKKLLNSVEKLRLKQIEAEGRDAEIKEYYKTEGKRRFQCVVNSHRKGEKTFELFTEDPNNPDKAIRLVGLCGVVLKNGLPQKAIDALNESYDLHTEETQPNQDPNIYYQQDFKEVRTSRYTVRVIKEIENPAPLGSRGSVRVKSIDVE